MNKRNNINNMNELIKVICVNNHIAWFGVRGVIVANNCLNTIQREWRYYV